MPFPGYLSGQEIRELTQKAVSGGLIDLGRPVGALRSIYLNGLPAVFALSLPAIATDVIDQFDSDLTRLSRVERLANGQVPLAVVLNNCAEWLRLRSRPEADDFAHLANVIQNRTSGVSRLPNPAVLPEVTSKQAVIGTDDMVGIGFLAAGAATAQSVARILVPRFENQNQVYTQQGPWLMVGTAWLIAQDLIITNHHVINARITGEPDASLVDFDRQAHEAAVQFGYEEPVLSTASENCAEIVASSVDLDYTVLRLSADPRRSPLKLFKEAVVFNATTFLPVNIIQHPRGLSKRIAFRNNLVSGADAQIIRYFTDTDHGSSGSPVCNDQWEVVALHRGAKYVTDVSYQGKPTAYVNFGSQIQAILGDLQIRFHDTYVKIMAIKTPD